MNYLIHKLLGSLGVFFIETNRKFDILTNTAMFCIIVDICVHIGASHSLSFLQLVHPVEQHLKLLLEQKNNFKSIEYKISTKIC